jgi:hypothetical protein
MVCTGDYVAANTQKQGEGIMFVAVSAVLVHMKR